MKISLKNIGKIKNSDIEINGITVIAGENNSGKSTIGKALFSIFNGFYNIEEKLIDEKKKSIIDNIYRNLGLRPFPIYRISSTNEEFDEYYDKIEQVFSRNKSNQNNGQGIDIKLKKILSDYINKAIRDNYFDKEEFIDFDLNKMVDHIKNIYTISNDEFVKHILSEILDAEFNGQINNIYIDDEGIISLTIQNREIKITIEDNEVTKIKNIIPIKTEAVYIDDPFLIDNYNPFYRPRNVNKTHALNHRQHLESKLFYNRQNERVIDELVTTKKLEKVLQKLNTVCVGDFAIKGRTAVYEDKNKEKGLDIKNLSAGLKTFVIIKDLLKTNVIEENGTIILDEPEVHLHPEWQLVFAELIVLIQKEFNMHILLTTHSPYFLNAIEVYSQKYQITNKCNYYLTSNKDGFSYTKECTDNIELIYKKLARPFQDLENERYRYEYY